MKPVTLIQAARALSLACAFPLLAPTARGADLPMQEGGDSASPEERRHPDGSVSMDAPSRAGNGIAARQGADGRVRMHCVDPAHASLAKHSHRSVPVVRDDNTAWE